MGFVRLASGRRVLIEPISIAEAWSRVLSLLDEPNVWIPTPTPQHAQIVGEILGGGKFTSNDIPDVHLAALSISHGLKLASHDEGFARFEGLRWFDPIAA